MANRNIFGGRGRKPRQDWNPGWILKILYTLGSAALSALKIAVGAAAVMLIFQSALNIFGSLDLLPLTGVTLVFVSRGGTSLIAAWLMIAFFKAAELHHSPIRDWGCEE